MNPLPQFENAALNPRLSRKMLDALVLEGADAVRALDQWLQETDFDKLGYNEFRLVPALFHYSAQGNATLPHYGRMKGIYRHFQYKNTLLFAEAKKAASLLGAEGVKVLFFKGAAFVLRFGWPPAIRPMSDLDLLVPRSSFEKAKEILLQNGWEYLYDQGQRNVITHSVDFSGPSGSGLDLHVRALLEVDDASFEDGLFARAIPHNWNGLPVHIMSNEDLALTTLINGVRNDGVAKYLWVHDLVRLVKEGEALDWKAVWKRAQTVGCCDRLFDALALAARLTRAPALFKILDDLLDADATFAQKKAVQAVASGQTYGSDILAKKVLDGLLQKAFPNSFPPFFGANAFQKASLLKGYVRHIRLLKNTSDQTEGLWIQRRYLRYLPDFFTPNHTALYRTWLKTFKEKEDGLWSFPAGILAPRAPFPLGVSSHKAEIRLLEAPKQPLNPCQKTEIRLVIKNISRFSWYIFEGSANRFGASYHLFDATGKECLLWENPRGYFLSPHPDYLVFLEPKGQIEVALALTAPDKPGLYTIKFDCVHENVCWFSEFNSGFPEIKIEVQQKEASGVSSQ